MKFRFMKPISSHRLVFLAFATITCSLTEGAPPALAIAQGVELSWATTSGNAYQPQISPGDPSWTDLGPELVGDGSDQSIFCPGENVNYQVLEIVPGAPGGPVTINTVANGGFESGNATAASNWNAAASQPPVRTSDDAHLGAFSMRGAIVNVGSKPGEGRLVQQLIPQGANVTAGMSYDFSFWAKQVSSGPSYIQQYEMQWLNGGGSVIVGTGLQNFSATANEWKSISVKGLIAPAGAAAAKITFRFVTGAVVGGGGEVLIDDVALESTNGSGPPGPPEIKTHPFTMQKVAKLTWPTNTGMDYRLRTATALAPENWTDFAPPINGDGNPASVIVPITLDRQFFRVEYQVPPLASPTNLRTVYSGTPNTIALAWDASLSPQVTGYRILFGTSVDELSNSLDVGNLTTAIIPGLTPGQTYFLTIIALAADEQSLMGTATLSAQPATDTGIVALYNSTTPLEPVTSIDTPAALITLIADRVRDRHAREDNFHIYDHYLSWYWEQRVANLEIVDRVNRNGGTDIDFNYTTQGALSAAEFRTFFRGIGTVAEYHNNQIATLVSTTPSATPGETDFNYRATVTANTQHNRPLQVGDRIEIEMSQFLAHPRNGRNNYYGTVLLYIVGQGIVPWAEGKDMGFDGGVVGTTNQSLDSYPLPTKAWLGGATTLPYHYSNEPEHRFKQTAGNISPTSGHAFMLGRRLHHTDFGNGVHSESGNPVFTEQIGKLGPKFISKSCVECHGNNGRALPPALGAPLLQFVVKTGADANGSPHPILGEQLQPMAVTGPAETSASILSYISNDGHYADGSAFNLRKPNYAFNGGAVPSYYSVRIAPQLVGLGLLEAVGEDTILALADPDDSDHDGISGRIRIVVDPETGEPRLGRFGYKASQARVSHQIAHALTFDMAVINSVFPKLDGESTASPVELDDNQLDLMDRYVSLLGVGARRNLNDDEALRGEQLLQTASCVNCHTPNLTTSSHHPMAELRNQTIHPYTDLLLHDMGSGLADNMGEDDATGTEWRTAPLWNIGLTSGVSGGEAYLHDGRARTLEEAILWHGGEGEESKQKFLGMSAADRAALVAFLKSL